MTLMLWHSSTEPAAHAILLRLTRSHLLQQHPRQAQSALCRFASSSSSTRWKSRQTKDAYAREAKVKGLKSRAAFKLLEINQKHKLFRRGDTVVDLGFAPGSWSQVAVSRTQPHGRVIGVDIIPAQPPRGVSTIQGNFLNTAVQERIRTFVQDSERGRSTKATAAVQEDELSESEEDLQDTVVIDEESERSYIDMERRTSIDLETDTSSCPVTPAVQKKASSMKEMDRLQGRVVDVVLSDMSEPWPQITGMWVNSISNPYRRMMNTSGIAFKDHAGSMDLCLAALSFCFDNLKTGGHCVLKYYQGQEEKSLEQKLGRLFTKVHREKPDASRDASKEAYFVALKRKKDIIKEQVFAD